MSFSQDVKLEILENQARFKKSRDALAFGFFSNAQSFSENEILLLTGYVEVANLFGELVQRILGQDALVATQLLSNNYSVCLPRKHDRQKLLQYFLQPELYVSDTQNAYAYLAGAFLSCGNISDPQKSYHLEFVFLPEDGTFFVEHMGRFLPGMRTTQRRKRMVVYFKECAQIQDVLTMIGAVQSSLKMIEVEMYKSIRNQANRVTNCETSNIDRTVNASTAQIEDIQLVLRMCRDDEIPENLLQTAKLRLENPYASLRELVELSQETISRSGMNHRLAALSRLAEELRRNKESAHV